MILLGVLGNPIEHSRSPEIHKAFAKQHQLDIEYKKIFVPTDEFSSTASSFLAAGAKGFNITLPCKHDAYKFVDEVSANAESAQAVNTILTTATGRLMGHNTDGPGLLQDLTQNLGWTLRKKRLLVIGAGGAVQGVISSLLNEQPACLHIVNRTQAKAKNIVDRALAWAGATEIKALPYAELENTYDVIISGSSAGLNAEQRQFELPPRIIGANTCCYDMIYARETTMFLRWCKKNQCNETSDGLGMLVEQAARAFALWLGLEVSTRAVMDQLRQS